MEIILELLNIFWNILLLVPKLLLDVFPLYKALSDFQQNLIASALGISPIIVWLLSKLFKSLPKISF